MKFICCLLALSCCHSLIGQNHAFVNYIEHKLQNNLHVENEELCQLMQIVEHNTNNPSDDSARVDAVHLLGKINCDTCILFLIDHITEKFNYGAGISDLDQANYTACWTTLINRSSNKSNKLQDITERWRLFSLCLTSLHESVRDETFLALFKDLLLQITSKEALKMIISDEINRNLRFHEPISKIYDSNLRNILL